MLGSCQKMLYLAAELGAVSFRGTVLLKLYAMDQPQNSTKLLQLNLGP